MRHRIAILVALAALTAGGCGPIVFTDASAIDVIGTAPEPEPVPVAMPERIELTEKVRFARNSARILEQSHPVLSEVADKIKAAPDIRRIRIEGHASADGNDAHNLELSSARARSVLEFLVAQGVAEDILTSEGLGETQPIADNDTADGREQNRRVELHVVERDTAAAHIDQTQGAASP